MTFNASRILRNWKPITALGIVLFAGFPCVSAQDNADGGGRRERRGGNGDTSGGGRGGRGDRDGGGQREGGSQREGGGGNRGGGPGGWGGGGGGWGGGPGGGFGGGPGGGGFGGGPGGWGGGPGGWGGGRGGPGGGGAWGRGGGFDPTSMLTRLDLNGNKQIDLDEMQGGARFMLERMARDNPKIDLTKPIPLSVLGVGNESSEESSAGDDEPLVPDFSSHKVISPIPGFGKAGERFSVKVQEIDQREASERLNRYDRNKDGALDENELRNGRWPDNPMQYDLNRDGKLQVSELAVRFANTRRSSSETTPEGDRSDNENQGRRGGGWGWGGGMDSGDAPAASDKKEAEVPVTPWQDRSSFRLKDSTAAKVQGAPGWFTAADANNDGQVEMKEFASDWNEAAVQDFRNFDINDDGVISGKECLAAVKKGVIRGAGPSSTSTASTTSAVSPTASSTEGSFELPPEAEEWRPRVGRLLKRFDNNKDGKFTFDEWSASEGDFGTIDSDKDGTITPSEWALYKVKGTAK